MLTLLILTLSLTPTSSSSSTLQLPIRDVLTLEDPEFSVLDFISLSYQPLLFPEALSKNTIAALTPWIFPSLSTSLEAATTFCVSSTESLNHDVDTETVEDVKKKSKKNGEAESVGKGESKESADAKETETDVEKIKEKRDEEKLNVERKATKEESSGRAETSEENEERNEVKREGKTEDEDEKERKHTEKETKDISDEAEGREKTARTEEKGGRERTEEGAEKETRKGKEIPMSLRRFGMEGLNRGWVSAFTTITKELGTAMTLPGVLKDADLTFLDLTKTGLKHVRGEWTERGGGGRGSNSAGVMCVVEGGLTLALTPLPPSIATLQCAAGECRATMQARQEQAAPLDLSFLVQAAVHPRACLYAPPGWQWAAAAIKDSTLLVFTFENDLVIKEDVVDQLFKGDEEVEEEEDRSQGARRQRDQDEAAEAPTLWRALPEGSSPPALLLWGDQNPLLHLLRRYLLSGRHLRRHAFLLEFQVDRDLLPDLVDCSRECQRSAVEVFRLLDADADGELTPTDATLLTHASFTSLSHQLDDLVDELKDLARDQWEEAVEGPDETRSAFLRRAKERLSASATAAVRRWVAGDLEETEEEALKEHLPALHDQVLAARGRTAPGDKEEL